VTILRVGELLAIVDYFVIATGLNPRQVKSIAEEIDHQAKARGVKKLFVDGLDSGKWVCMDFADVVVHVFLPELREYYGLEHLWADAFRLSIAGVTDASPGPDTASTSPASLADPDTSDSGAEASR
jgi:ribosome-associated protein